MAIDLEQELVAALGAQRVVATFEELIRRIVRDELARAGFGDELIDVPRAARLLSMTEGAVTKAAERGTLPCVRIGRRLRFKPAELLAQPRRGRGAR